MAEDQKCKSSQPERQRGERTKDGDHLIISPGPSGSIFIADARFVNFRLIHFFRFPALAGTLFHPNGFFLLFLLFLAFSAFSSAPRFPAPRLNKTASPRFLSGSIGRTVNKEVVAKPGGALRSIGRGASGSIRTTSGPKSAPRSARKWSIPPGSDGCRRRPAAWALAIRARTQASTSAPPRPATSRLAARMNGRRSAGRERRWTRIVSTSSHDSASGIESGSGRPARISAGRSGSRAGSRESGRWSAGQSAALRRAVRGRGFDAAWSAVCCSRQRLACATGNPGSREQGVVHQRRSSCRSTRRRQAAAGRLRTQRQR